MLPHRTETAAQATLTTALGGDRGQGPLYCWPLVPAGLTGTPAPWRAPASAATVRQPGRVLPPA